MIEKKIHYIWFGGEKPEKIEKCINSWKKNLREYEIIEWNERNLDIEKLKKENKFFKLCYEKKIYGVMTDYLRTKILYEQGGVYLDADIEILKPIDELLKNVFFLGKEDEKNICYAVIGSVPKHNFLKNILSFYEEEVWKTPYYISTNIIGYILSQKYTSEKLDKEGIKIYSKEYFYPYHWSEEFNEKLIKENTYCIHRWDGSWSNNPNRLYLEYKHLNPFLRFFKIKIKLLKFYLKGKYNR